MSTRPTHPEGPVVVAYAPDRFGRAALDHGARTARTDGVALIIVNATRGDAYVDKRFAADDELAALERELSADGLAVSVRHDLVDDVADAVVAVADAEEASLIVVGVRRRTAVGKALLGSVAQRVILDAHCPVLAVKPDEDAQ
ncbi:universal stress protein [Nocardioides sambongensis]|uniref:universal stress protein n=1 Tax=Nocardioides sambongensis TaxID=2589074 RepID=UPI00112A9FC4|nr:universal stress protein [Nocardioides sambongensis]